MIEFGFDRFRLLPRFHSDRSTFDRFRFQPLSNRYFRSILTVQLRSERQAVASRPAFFPGHQDHSPCDQFGNRIAQFRFRDLKSNLFVLTRQCGPLLMAHQGEPLGGANTGKSSSSLRFGGFELLKFEFQTHFSLPSGRPLLIASLFPSSPLSTPLSTDHSTGHLW